MHREGRGHLDCPRGHRRRARRDHFPGWVRRSFDPGGSAQALGASLPERKPAARHERLTGHQEGARKPHMNTATVSIKPRLVLNPDAEDIPGPAPDETALIRVEVKGVGSFRIRVELSPAGLNDAGAVPADFLWATAWRATDDPSSDTDAKAGVAPVFEDEGDEGDDEEDEDEDEEGGFVEDEGLEIGRA